MAIMVNLETNAGTVEGHTSVNVNKIDLIKNDGEVDIQFGFDAEIADGNYRTLKPEESIENIDYNVGTLYYKTASGTAAFRFWGRDVKVV